MSINNKLLNNFMILMGNALEFYDFMLYGVLASYLAVNFFPGESPVVLLFQVYGSFAVGYIARPIGAFYFGNLGDSKGRKNLLSYACVISGVATTLIGFMPSYAAIGIWSTIGLIGLRLVQGFSLSGEQCGSLVFLSETNINKNYIGCLYMVSIFGGVLLATGGCYILFMTMSESSLTQWGWRLPFIFSFPLCMIAFYVRKKIYETTEFMEIKNKHKIVKVPMMSLFKQHGKKLFLPLIYAGIYASLTSLYMVAIPGYFKVLNIVSGKQLFLLESLGLFLIILMMPIISKFIYRYEFKIRVLICTCSSVIFAAIAIHFLSKVSLVYLVYSIIILAFAIALISTLLVDVICSPFPAEVRCSGVSVSFNLAVTVFSSSTPFIMLHFMHQRENMYMIFWYLLLGGITIFALSILRKKEIYLPA